MGEPGGTGNRGMRRSVQQQAADAERWVAARDAGMTVEAIAASAAVGVATPSRAPAHTGPFPRQAARPRLSVELLTV